MSVSFTAPERALLEALAGAPDHRLAALGELALEWHVEGPWLDACVEAEVRPPTEIVERAEASRLDAAAKASWLLWVATRFGAELARATIEHRFVKGVAIVPSLKHVGNRWMDDVDVLVLERDRARLISAARAFGCALVDRVEHDGRLHSEAPRGSLEFVDADGAIVDVHFVRELPGRNTVNGLDVSEPTALATGLCRHVLEHHTGAKRFLARHICDLRVLLDTVPQQALLAASVDDASLRASLAWLAWLGAPEMVDQVEPRPLPSTPPGRALLRSAASAFARGGWHVGFPARAYLELHDPAAVERSLLRLHVRRWRRLLRGTT